MERRRTTYYKFEYENTEITLETKKVSTENSSRVVAGIKKISCEQTRITDESERFFDRLQKQEPRWITLLGIWKFLFPLIGFLILFGPVILNGVDKFQSWYLSTPLAQYVGLNLSTDQINLIAEKVLDAFIYWIMNQ
jgi:hypothetical protein